MKKRYSFFLIIKLKVSFSFMYAVSDWLCVVGLVHILTETESSPNFAIRASLLPLISFCSNVFSTYPHLPGFSPLSPLHDLLCDCEEKFLLCLLLLSTPTRSH